MSHCTKFNFTYSCEESIVRAFRKMNVQTSLELITEFDNDFQKKILSHFGYMGRRQMRAICGIKNGINMYMCKVAENRYELICEHPNVTPYIKDTMNKLGSEFQQAYVEVAIEAVVKKIEISGTPVEVKKQNYKYIIKFGPSLEYQVVVSFDDNVVTEEVFGIKGDFCTSLTEDIENILSHPESELISEFKPEIDMVVEDQVLQVVSLNF